MIELKPSLRATISDVAKLAGVSTATVSRVINQNATVADETAKRVKAAIAELNYVPYSSARGLASRKTNTLGFLTLRVSTPFFTPLVDGIETLLREEGLNLLIAARGSSSPLQEYHRPLGEHNTDGILVFADSMPEWELRHLHSIKFPMVLLNQAPPEGLEIPFVTFQNKAGARRLIDHLIKIHDCKRIAYLRGPEGHQDSYWREKGYRESLEAHGIPFNPELVVSGNFNLEESLEQVSNWLRAGVQVDAIFGGDDDSAAGAISAIMKAGRLVPQDIAVVGFDDVPFARRLTPALTTVRAPIKEAGYQAASLLVDLINEKQVAMSTLLPTELVVRRSCGCG